MLMKQTLIKLGTINKVVNNSVTNFVTNNKRNNNKMSITSTSGFFKKGKGKKPVKLPKLKEEDFIEAIEKDEENEKKGYVTTHNFFK